jgi:hypothetical protein
MLINPFSPQSKAELDYVLYGIESVLRQIVFKTSGDSPRCMSTTGVN